ncbi:hypothetical protein [Providencia rettgeri]|uniref:hypothetical protein n=1 Tax=Providencia rettgeri TaxID=587 RepID=UPI00029BA43E|nr:hypothetical protein [Providencia rettgeri]EKT54861.1 hypothetical protein OOC_14999 [Providencia rettgeri Dmel1]
MDGIIKITGFATLLFFSVQACASLVLQGTRIIFPSDKKAVGIQLTNYSEEHKHACGVSIAAGPLYF